MKIGELVRCPRCNSENPPEYRFCGMCGTPLDKPAEPAARSGETVANQDRARRRPEPAPSAPQSLSGPSFLGLSGPARDDRDVTYLFEEEQPKRTYWRFTLLLLFLAVIGGLGYLQYTRSGKSWVPPWAHQQPTTPEQASQQPPATTPPQTSAAQPAANPPANGQAAAPNQPGSPPPPKETDLAPGTTQPAQPAASAPAQAPGSAPPSQAAAAPAQTPTQQTPASTEPAKNQPEPAPETKVAKNEADTNQPDTTEEVPAPKAKPARVKPAPAPVTNPDDALVSSAEKYLYGRGVPQNCDRALISLRAAANRQNVRAQSLLGTMYATGHCVPRDLPNAYRWFALVSRQQTDNMWIQRNLEMIWREMTPQERQLAMQSSR